ncbi:hypothetical protein KSF_015930 [Reticulibacter mediterranei]|uniref:HTH cro/C1-type domain-containing protein n=1 Tax=Reticulibacter mediterranei TaxID=2778369 RepID=A0A8J3IIU0_9CHLR|nr:helix-turn-helix transcriptional regulator [Reticulibacter mediterranei]GHO91545.1 hypothetical protein KSF_015930 [Reticulibacter mediterranei]
MASHASKKQPNERLTYYRKLQHWTQTQLADELYKLCDETELNDHGVLDKNMVSKWERGENTPGHFWQKKLCTLFKKDAKELGFIDVPGSHSLDLTLLRSDAEQDTESSTMDKSKRLTLQVLGLTGTSLITGNSEIENLLVRKVARLQSWFIDSLEDGTLIRWQLYYTATNSLTENGLRSQITRLEQIADEGGSEHARICRILAQNYQLAGSLARDRFQYSKAKDYFHKAEQAANESELPADMLATATARRGLALLRQERVEEALHIYRHAVDASVHAEPLTRAYVFSGLAEALARNGEQYRDECYHALDQAELLLDRAHNVPPEEDFAFVRLTMQSLQDSRGECHVLLGEPYKGLEYLQKAEKQLDHKLSRSHCRLLMQQSEAFLVAGQPDDCVEFALKGLQVARILESASSINWSREIYAKLLNSQWKGEPVVEHLASAL